MFDFKGKVVLITGASYGLGEQFAYAFADAGADLILTARSLEILETVGAACRDKGATVTVVHGDVSIEADVHRVIESGIEAHGHIDVLINNAGIADARGVAAEQFDTETFNQIISVTIKPGETELTRTPRSAHSTPSWWVRLSRPPFAAV